MNRTTSKIIGATLIVFTLGGGAALAQGTMAEQDACRHDVFRLCGSYIPDVGQIVACLRGNEARREVNSRRMELRGSLTAIRRPISQESPMRAPASVKAPITSLAPRRVAIVNRERSYFLFP